MVKRLCAVLAALVFCACVSRNAEASAPKRHACCAWEKPSCCPAAAVPAPVVLPAAPAAPPPAVSFVVATREPVSPPQAPPASASARGPPVS